jgi:ARC6-like, IMS domain
MLYQGTQTIVYTVRSMQLVSSKLLFILGMSLGLATLPALAQVSDSQVGALVEALRQAAPQTGIEDDGLYSDWQIKPDNIPRWSRLCTGRELSISEFEASPATARGILVCVMRDVLQEEYGNSGNNESVAVRRAASWWMTGDPDRYDNDNTAAYTQRVLDFYQQQRDSNQSQQQDETNTAAAPQPSPVYDRYMRAGYAATGRRDYDTAMLYFQRALDERPNDPYAQQAIRNVESYRDRQTDGNNGESEPAAQPQSTLPPAPTQSQPVVATPISSPPQAQEVAAVTSAASFTPEQAVGLITQWLQAKQQIFAPPFNRDLATELTTGELYVALVEQNGVMDWLQDNEAYYRFGVQDIGAVERFAANNNRATIEVEVTEERTLYQNGNVNPDYTNFDTELVRFSLESVNGNWRIADYKTVNGSLLERAVLQTPNSVDSQ